MIPLFSVRRRFHEGAVDAAPIITYVTTVIRTATDIGSRTYLATPLGNEADDRYIVVGCGTEGSGAETTALTVSGVSATLATGIQTSARSASLWIAQVPTGTTGDIFVDYSNVADEKAIVVWNITGLNSATPHDTATLSTAAGNLAIDIPATGVVAALAFCANTSAVTWTNATENVDLQCGSFRRITGASYTATGAETARAIDVSCPDASRACAASWS